MSRGAYTPLPRFEAPAPPATPWHRLAALAAFLAVAAAFVWAGHSRMKDRTVAPPTAAAPVAVALPALSALSALPAPETGPEDSTMMVRPGALREEAAGVPVSGGVYVPPVEPEPQRRRESSLGPATPQQALKEVFWDGRTAAVEDDRAADVVRWHHTIRPGGWSTQHLTFKVKIDGKPSGQSAAFGPAQLNPGFVFVVLVPGRSRPHSIVVDLFNSADGGTTSRTRISGTYDGSGSDKWTIAPLQTCYLPGGHHGAGPACGP
jgi:hypothetical protein